MSLVCAHHKASLDKYVYSAKHSHEIKCYIYIVWLIKDSLLATNHDSYFILWNTPSSLIIVTIYFLFRFQQSASNSKHHFIYDG